MPVVGSQDTSPPTSAWDLSRLPLAGIISRKVDERAPLSAEEQAEVVRNEALTAESPWDKRRTASLTAREFAKSIGYPWPSSEMAVPVSWRTKYRVAVVATDALRLFSARGRRLRALKSVLIDEVELARHKQWSHRRYIEEKNYGQHIRDWWREEEDQIDADLMDDMSYIFPGYSDAELRAEMGKWSRNHRINELERRRQSLLRAGGSGRPSNRR